MIIWAHGRAVTTRRPLRKPVSPTYWTRQGLKHAAPSLAQLSSFITRMRDNSIYNEAIFSIILKKASKSYE